MKRTTSDVLKDHNNKKKTAEGAVIKLRKLRKVQVGTTNITQFSSCNIRSQGALAYDNFNTSVSGSVLGNRAVELPVDLYKLIFEYMTEGMIDHMKFLSLLRINTVCKSFNIAFDKFIEQMLRNSTVVKAILFGNMLVDNKAWTVSAIYYFFAIRFLAADTCQNTQAAKHLSEICSEVLKAFETEFILLGMSDASSIKKTNVGFDVEYKRVTPTDLFNAEFAPRVIKFNEKNDASINALNMCIQSYCLSDQIFKIPPGASDLLIDFLVRHNSKDYLPPIIAEQVQFFCSQFLNNVIFSADFLISLLKRDLIDQKSVRHLLGDVFTMLRNPRTRAVPDDRCYMLRLLQHVLKMNQVILHKEDVQFLKVYAFAEFAAPEDRIFPVQRKDAAMGIIQELIAAGHLQDLKLSEIQILKNHAIKSLAYESGDLDFRQDVIELLGFITETKEWFSLVSVSHFEYIHQCFITNSPKYCPSAAQRLVKIYDLFLKHPEEKVRFLVSEISILIQGRSPVRR